MQTPCARRTWPATRLRHDALWRGLRLGSPKCMTERNDRYTPPPKDRTGMTADPPSQERERYRDDLSNAAGRAVAWRRR